MAWIRDPNGYLLAKLRKCSSTSLLEAFVGLADLLVGVVASSYLVLAISQGAGLLIAALVNPIIQIAIVLIYFDLRVRREALDLFQLAQHVSSTQPA